MSSRGGFSLVEALVALLLGVFVVHLGLTTASRLGGAREALAARAEGLVARRVARHVLRRELRRGEPGVDWTAGGDSIALRAFRGSAVVCANDSATAELVVAYEGERLPDAAKDSVVLVGPVGRVGVRAVTSVGASAGDCLAGTGTTRGLRMQLDTFAPPETVAVGVFELGSYHVTGAALRYRRGSSGRQPLTPSVWSSSAGLRASARAVGIDAVPRSAAEGRPWHGFLAWIDAP